MDTAVKKPNFLMRFLDKRLTTSQFEAKNIVSLFFPMLLDQFSIFGMNILASAMVSASSQEAISAMSLSGTLAYLMVTLFTSLTSGGTVLVAQAKGRADEKEIRHTCGQTVALATMMGMVATALLVLCAPFLVELFFGNASDVIVEYGTIYLKLYGWSLLPFAVFNSISCCFAGMGKAKHCLVLSIIINAVHLVMSFVFINLMDMGITGTGLSLIVARGVGAVAAIILMFFVGDRNSRLLLKDLFYLSFDFIKKILRLALPIAVGSLLTHGGQLLTNSFISSLPSDEIAAHSIGSSIYNLMLISSYAMMGLSTTVCGQCIGAKNYELAKHYIKQFVRLGRLALIANIAIVAPLLPLLMLMYQPSATVQPIIYRLIAIGAVCAIALYCNAILQPICLRSAGDATFTTVSSLIVMWTVRVFICYLLAIVCGIGIYAVWMINILDYGANSTIYALRLKGNKWHKM